jgi:hypothetical protein
VKNHDYTPKNHIFSNFRESACRMRHPLDPPLGVPECVNSSLICIYSCYLPVLYYSKSHTLPQETYISSYFVTLDMHTGHVHLFQKIRSLSLLKNDNTRKRTKRQHYIVKQRLKIPSCNQKLYV